MLVVLGLVILKIAVLRLVGPMLTKRIYRILIIVKPLRHFANQVKLVVKLGPTAVIILAVILKIPVLTLVSIRVVRGISLQLNVAI